jgi:hypothetical protein
VSAPGRQRLRPGAPFNGSQGWGGYDPSDNPDDPHDGDYEVGDGAPTVGPLPPNLIAGDVGDVDADFDGGGGDGYSAGDFADIPDNIIV